MNNSTAVVDRTAVLASARAFADAVAHTPAVSEYTEAVSAVRADAAAIDLLQNAEQLRRTIHLNGGAQNNPDEQQQLVSLEADIAAHPALQRFFAAQQDLIQQLRSVNAGLTEALGFDFASMARPACSCG